MFLWCRKGRSQMLNSENRSLVLIFPVSLWRSGPPPGDVPGTDTVKVSHTTLPRGLPGKMSCSLLMPRCPNINSRWDGYKDPKGRLSLGSLPGNPEAHRLGSATSHPVWSWLSLLRDVGAKANHQFLCRSLPICKMEIVTTHSSTTHPALALKGRA